MFIKKLEIYGFKSFPYKVVIPFSKGITALVGPNGAGKSNILDAIKWILGEQSPKKLRVKDLSDLIYSGNSNKKIDFAEVKLTLLHQPPILEKYKDLEEIVLIRRYYREGESEFFINQKPCRLKDIQFLFLGLGVNPQSFGIIDQGEINRFLEISPKERKGFLEDLAGVSKIKYTEEETERNIRETELNLIRINDILKEVEIQYINLKEQSKLAKRYLYLKETLKDLSIKKTYSTYKRTLMEKEKFLEELNKIKIKQSNLEMEYERLEDQERELIKDYLNIEREKKDLNKEKEEREKEIKKFEEELMDLYKKERDLSFKIEKEKIKEDNIYIKRRDLMKLLDNLIKEYDRKKTIEIEKNERITYLKQEKKDREELINSEKKALRSISEEFEKVNNEIIKLNENLNFLSKEIERLNREEQKMLEERARISTLIEKNEKEKIFFDELLKKKEALINKIDEEINNLKVEEEHLKTQANDLKEEKIKLESEIKNIKENLKLLDQILAKEEKGFEKKWINQTLGNTLKNEPKKLTLLEHFYGDLLKAIIVNDMEELKKINIESNENLIFILKESLNKIKLDVDFIEDLNLINQKEDSFVYLPNQKLLFTPYGFILAIKKDKKGYYSLNIEKKFIKDKEEKITNLLKNLENSEKTLTTQLSDLQNNLKNLFNKRNDLLNERKKYYESLNKINLDKIRFEEILTNIEEQLTKINQNKIKFIEEKEDIINKQNILNTKRENLLVKKKEKQESLDKLNREIKDKETHLINFEKELVKIKTEKEEINKQIEKIKKDLDEIKKFLSESKYKNDILKNELDYIKEKIKKRKEKLKHLKEEFQKLVEIIQEKDKIIEEKNINLKEISTLKRKIEQERNSLNQSIHNYEIKITELNLIIENLKKEWREWCETDIGEVQTINLEHLLPDNLSKEIEKIKNELKGFQDVNLASIKEFELISDRYNHLLTQKEDLEKTIDNLKTILMELKEKSKEKLIKTLFEVNKKLSEIFPFIMEGARAELYFTEDDPLKAGLELKIHFPHKNIKHLSMLSGGEKSLCVIALLIAFYLTKPGPFCILDEVDAALDEKNSLKFINLLKKIKDFSQIILITHNPKVMKEVDNLIGVTMEEKGVSKVIKLDLKN